MSTGEVRGFGDKDSSTFSKTIRNSTSFQESSFSIKQELRTQTTSTSVGTVRNSVRARSRVFLQCKEFIKFSLINGPTDVIRSVLNMSQTIFMLVMSRASLACLENGSPILTKSSFSKRWPSSSVTALRDGTGSCYARHVVHLCIWLKHCLFLTAFKGDS